MVKDLRAALMFPPSRGEWVALGVKTTAHKRCVKLGLAVGLNKTP